MQVTCMALLFFAVTTGLRTLTLLHPCVRDCNGKPAGHVLQGVGEDLQ